ncbi:caspase domain-domain-containing protein [Coniella lustricola]|uniref:Caspase domain-domain-containing protein n=1 Tax=Coniella lustricola TaxID=2025994 RepID=A0A2T3AIU4_9PEZI|nr:caspase domain-domain-containing protein [Coniella lustricola]
MFPGQGHGPGGHHPHGHGPPPGQWGPPQQPQYGGYNQGPPQGYNQGPPQGYYPPPHQHQHHQQPPYQHQQQQYQPPPPPNYGNYPPQQQQQQQQYGQQQYGQQPPYNGGGGGAFVPRGSQRFGHGAPEGYTFQYSQCTGRRKALLIGINYFGSQNALKGCINDVHNVSNFLMQSYNYKREDMVILTDDASNPVLQPTKDNILRAMQWLVKDAQPNDALFLHYSGHGGQTKDLDGDEDDGYDEVIYPVDFKQAGHIVDDQIHAICVAPLQPGVRLTCIFDSCHSGSVIDLPYVYSTKGALKEPNLAKEAGQGLLSAAMSYAKGDMSAVMGSLSKLFKSAVSGDKAYEKTMRTKTSPADVILWSGSKDDQTSADATIAAQATGAMSWAFITAVKQNPNQTYLQMLNSVRDVLQSKYTQKPQLSCSHPLGTWTFVVLFWERISTENVG